MAYISRMQTLTLILTLLAWQTPPESRFTILHTNDEHSALVADSKSGGVARLATAIRQIRERNTASGEPVLLISAGDFSTGTPYNWLVFAGQSPELSLMLDLGYDLVVLGNHEFDYGPDPLADYLFRLGYPATAQQLPVLSANIRIPEGHRLATAGIGSHHLIELPDGTKLGFIGLMGREAADVAPFKVPVSFDDATRVAREQVEALRSKGASLLIAVTHSGLQEDLDLAAAVPELDLIIGGHSHTLIEDPIRVGKTVVVQAGSSLSHLGILDLAFDPQSGRLRLVNGERGSPYVRPLGADLEEDPAYSEQVSRLTTLLDAQLHQWTSGRVTGVMDVLTETDFPLPNEPILQESPMGNFVTDAIRTGVERATGKRVDAAFMANGVIRGAIAAGPVTFYSLASFTGLGSGPDFTPGYPLISVYLTGRELRRVLEMTILLSQLRGDMYYLQVSGLRYEYDLDRMLWGRVPFKGTPVPSSRSVLRAWRDTPEGLVPLEWDDGNLYHVVSDYYNASFLPFVGTILPNLTIEFKDEEGIPVSIDDRIVYRDGLPYKVWQAVADYAIANPRTHATYSARFQRQIPIDGPSLWRMPIVLLVLVFIGTLFLIRIRRKRA